MIDQKKLAIIHIVKKELQLNDEEYRRILFNAVGVHSAKELDENKFRKLMNYFLRSRHYRVNDHGMTLKQKIFIKSMVHQLHWEEEHLTNFIHKYYHKSDFTKLTRKEASKAIEGLKHIKEYKLRRLADSRMIGNPMKKQIITASLFLCFIFGTFSCASLNSQSTIPNSSQEVLPQHRQEVSEIYKECLEYKHGVMLQCIQKKVNELGENVNIFRPVTPSEQVSEWQAPEEYIQRENPFSPTEANLKKGEEIYQFYCSACHGSIGKEQSPDIKFGKEVANLTSSKLLQKTDGAIFWKITEGGWPMPAFWEGDVLSEDDIWMLINFLRTLEDQK
ncbi:MAG: c-type cytochrome [Candidatus Omnitrophica bacterium]|nr:c-type cytochrome [Candidatus Omnitrophota bacterium]